MVSETNSKIILFNGAKLCGKDTAIDYLKDTDFSYLVRAECKDHLHDLTMRLFNVTPERYWQIYNDRSLKELPLDDFYINLTEEDFYQLRHYIGKTLTEGREYKYENDLQEFAKYLLPLTIREAMIYVSEVVCKPRFGMNYFGEVRANNLKEKGFVYVDGSCGFKEELPPLIDKLGQENILLIRVHRDGYTFEGDSRGLMPDGVLDNTIDIYNDKTLEGFLDKVYEEVCNWLS